MKKAIAVLALAGGLSVCAMAEEWTGYIMDQSCAGKKEMQGNVDCAKACIKRGSPAVLVTSDGTIYKIANQNKAIPHAGQKVTVSGKMENGEIQISSVK
jgi:hypothetical protein